MKKTALIISFFCFGLYFSQKNQNYIPIGYTSICCGPPSPDPVINYITKFQKKNKLENFEIYQQHGLGKEGEFSLYIGIDHLSTSQKANFLKRIQSIVSSQNNSRKKTRDGYVNFAETGLTKREELLRLKNLTIYKKRKND